MDRHAMKMRWKHGAWYRKGYNLMETTEQQVAEWMVQEIRFKGMLYQSEAIEYVKTHFGEQFVFVNENGNASLSKEVKKAFRKLHRGRIAWDRDAFFWAWT